MLTWLHLSDLHACRPRSGWKADRILKTLRADLERLRDDHGLKPDLIFFTGDAAFGHLGDGKGKTLPEQFAHAEELFAGVREICGVAQQDFFLVPGNHDVHRGKVEDPEIEWLDGLHRLKGGEAADKIDALLAAAGRSWRGYMERLADYRAFLVEKGYEHLLGDPDRLVWAQTRTVRGLRVGVAGFNTAWSCCRDNEKGRLWFGSRWQVETLKTRFDDLDATDGAATDLRIALTHHPSSWLTEREDPGARRGLQYDYDVHLHGHEHEGWVTDQPKHLRIAAGACYADSSEEEQSYNLVHLEVEPRPGGGEATEVGSGAGARNAVRRTGRVWLREYSPRGKGGWVPFRQDEDVDEKGRWALRDTAALAVSAGTAGAGAETAGAGTAPSPRDDAEIRGYVGRLRAACNSLTPVGFQKRVRIPLRLDEVYVPLRVRPQDALMLGDHRLFGAGRELDGAADRDLGFEQALALAARKGRRGLLVLGDPGSGKTTLLKHLVLAAVAEQVPVLIELRYLEDPAGGLRPALEEAVARADGTLASAPVFAQKLLDRGHLLVLVDGLDEVPDQDRRAEVCRWLEQATHTLPHSTFVVTSRYAGYRDQTRLDGRFLECHVRDLIEEEVRRFLGRWYQAVERQVLDQRDEAAAKRAAEEGAADLAGRIYNPDDPRCASLQRLAENPLMLQILCLVHRDRNYLPDRRVELYSECVHVMLEEWRRVKKLPVDLTADQALALLQPLAFELHRRHARQAPAEEIAAALARPLEDLGYPADRAEALLATIRDQSGVLVLLDRGEYGFLHLSFQEYLTARHLQDHVFRHAQLLAGLVEHFHDPWWQEVVLLAVGLPGPSLFEPLMEALLAAGALERYSDLADRCQREASRATPEPFLKALAQGELSPGERYQALLRLRSFPSWKERTVELATLTHPAGEPRSGRAIVEVLATAPIARPATGRKAPREQDPAARKLEQATRSLAAELLGLPAAPSPAGDLATPPAAQERAATRGAPAVYRSPRPEPRPGEEWLHQPSGQALVYVPGGEYRLGEELPIELFGDGMKEFGWKKEQVEEWLSRSRPVHTVTLSPFWIGKYPVTNADYRRFLEAKPKAPMPEQWKNEAFNQPEQPVVGVSWEDVQTYCEWAQLDLPSEAQWEAAARGTDGRRYPWGDQEPTAELANFDARVGRTTPVGAYPAGAGPFGTLDQAGNVWEWCADVWDPRAYDARDGETDPLCRQGDAAIRVLRGGSWDYPAGILPAAFRVRFRSGIRNQSIGFRCLCLARPEP